MDFASPMTTPDQNKSIYPVRPEDARVASRSNNEMRSGMTPKHRSKSDQNCCAWDFSVCVAPVAIQPSIMSRHAIAISSRLRRMTPRSRWLEEVLFTWVYLLPPRIVISN